MRVLSAAIDLGTTRIKAGHLQPDGALRLVASREAPPLTGGGELRESDPAAYLREVERALEDLATASPAGVPLGVACQRSTFAIWEPTTGEPRTPLISWQDRRAAAWCERHAAIGALVQERTGLRLSPHYAGPKLAALIEADPWLGSRLAGGTLRTGTLECWVLSRLTEGAPHETDLTMAGRTLLADPRAGRWDPELLDRFSVPAPCLPRIAPTAGREGRRLGGFRITASLADQAAAAVAVIAPGSDDAVVSLGTGGFVLRVTGDRLERPEGYLAGPILAMDGRSPRYASEGTINGIVESLARFGAPPTPPLRIDPSPAAFALPDVAGIGAPHWIPGQPPVLSEEAGRLDEPSKRRVVLEGIIFRVREILDGLFEGTVPGRVLLCGGLAGEPGLPEGLAACLGRQVEVLEEAEAALLGAARLAAGLPPGEPPPRARAIGPGEAGAYLREKWERWRRWLTGIIDDGSAGAAP